MPLVARVAVSSVTYAIDKPYEYRVTAELKEKAKPGCRVLVPFGSGNKMSEAMILSLAQVETDKELKSIVKVLDDSPVLDEFGLKLALWLRQRCFCALFDVVKAMLPSGLLYKTRDSVYIAAGIDRDKAYESAGKSKKQAVVLDVLFANGGECAAEVLSNAFDGKYPTDAVKSLSQKEIVYTETSAYRMTADKTSDIVSLEISPEEAMVYANSKSKSAPLQASVLRTLAAVGEASAKELCYFTGASMVTVRNLIKKGFLSSRQVEIFRRPEIEPGDVKDRPVLNSEQQAAYDGLKQLMFSGKPNVALLYGVTGSGKTQVYISLIYDALSKNKTALVLVPEIALTPQLMKLFAAHFGDSVAILHSSLRATERYDEWKRINAGKARVVIGTRSAVFAPLKNIGVIIIDEEHEQTYKSEASPRYHARDVAKYRCVNDNALLVLGSATPSVESMHSAVTGTYSLFRLNNRYNRQHMPRVLISDTKKEFSYGNFGSVGSVLAEEIGKNLDRGEQTILFLNRRGTSRIVSCSKCGYVPECDRCSVKMTYHQANGRLMCHYCGRSVPIPSNCPECGGAFQLAGFGTQHLEEELEELFPGTRVIRMDADSVSSSNSHEKILSRFEKEQIPILIGTQMVTKGLDFENVTLVGVIDADVALNSYSFRSNERTFSQITQVVGRAGRGDKEGRAVIQTMTPLNSVLNLASVQDYDSFFNEEIQNRELLNAPPFADHIVLTFAGMNENMVENSAMVARDVLSRAVLNENISCDVIGPAPAQIARINNRFRYRLTIVGKNDKKLRNIIEQFLVQHSKNRINKGVVVYADVNPYD